MKKWKLMLVSIILVIGYTTPIKANENINILVSIQNDANRYLVEISDEKIKVKTISNKLYTSIPCLNNEKDVLEDIDFSNITGCLINSLENALHLKITNYVNLDMKTLLKDLDLPKNAYNYQSLRSLTKVTSKIMDRLNVSVLMNYKDYVDTDLGFKDIYSIYKKVKKKHLKVYYYDLKYFIYDDAYLVFDTTFYKKST